VRSDTTADVVILGSGAAGLTAAIAASDHGSAVHVFEKAATIGGSSAVSGGVVWIANNHHCAAAGIEDSREDALAYLESLSLGRIDSDLAATFVDVGSEMIRYLEDHTPVRFRLLDGYPDYHPEHPGGKPLGGRSLDNELFSFASLGEWADRITTRVPPLPLTLAERLAARHGAGPDVQTLAHRSTTQQRAIGHALIGALLQACLDRRIQITTGARARKLVLNGNRVEGVVVEHNSAELHVSAPKGVVLATGGFEWNEEFVTAFLRGPMTAPTTPPDNEGDGLVMAMRAGAALGNMSEAWWVPVIRVPDQQAWGREAVHLVVAERTYPRSIMVNRKGRRFTNEACNYNAMGGALHAFDPGGFDYVNLPAWLVFDHDYKLRHPVASCPPGREVPNWMPNGAGLRDLARLISVDADALENTVERFNKDAVAGHDPDFGRGNSVYDTFNGDHSLEGVAATLGPLDRPPFYAVQIEMGSLGTKGGPRTDVRARVINLEGDVIHGLYAAGNVMAGPTGMAYPGAGGTLGPAMTWGFIAGRDASTRLV